MKKVLFITTRLFWPTDSGRKLSLYYYCKGLHDKYDCEIYLYPFLEAGQGEKDCDGKPDFIKEIRLAKPIAKGEKLKNLLFRTFLLRRWPMQCSLFFSKENGESIKRYAEEIQPDLIITDMIRTSMYYDYFRNIPCRKVLDMDDMLSKRYKRQLHSSYASNISGQYGKKLPGFLNKLLENNTVKHLVLRTEAGLTEKAEMRYSKVYDKVIFVSPMETAAMNKKLPDKAVTISVGINPMKELPKVKKEDNLLSFVGNLSVAANIDSLDWIVNKILPKVHHPVKFMVVGKAPEEIKAKYKNNKQVFFTGRVERLEDYVCKSRIFLSPLLYGTGIKTKILEAMSMGVPVITNDVGAEGIAVESGRDIWVENGSETIAEKVDYVLDHQEESETMAESGKKLVEEKYCWEDIWKKFAILFE